MTQALRKTMKAVAIDRFGGIETLKTQELPVPAVDADDVLIHVEAAGVGVVRLTTEVFQQRAVSRQPGAGPVRARLAGLAQEYTPDRP